MPITPPPTPPSRANPATFSDDADAWNAWFPTFVDDYNDDAALMGRRYVTYGGTANAITLSGALPAGAVTIPIGTQVRFRATATNTGAATINLDGVGAIACRTVTGVALPSGYVRTGVDTTATYDGSYWVINREVEVGSNSNGFYMKLETGYLMCRRYFYVTTMTLSVTGYGGFYTNAGAPFTWPHAFANENYSSSISSRPSWNNKNGDYSDIGSPSSGSCHAVAIGVEDATASGAQVTAISASANPGGAGANACAAELTAVGTWY